METLLSLLLYAPFLVPVALLFFYALVSPRRGSDS